MKYDDELGRERLKDKARSKAILEVAQSFGMELEKQGKEYNGKWQGHESFKLNPQTNQFYWNGKSFGGDVIDLVSVLKYGVTSKNEAKEKSKRSIVFLAKMEVGTFNSTIIPEKRPFNFFYDEDDNFDLGRPFLKEKRGYSDKTIDFFLEQGVISQGKYRTNLENGEYFYEPVIFFKNLDTNGNAIGGSVHGIEPHPEIPEHKHKSGYLKKALLNSESNSGLKVVIGNPKAVIPLEAPFDLMAYYELNKEKLNDVILIANDGYKPDAYWRAMAEVIASSPLLDREKFRNKEALINRLIRDPENFLRRNYQSFITLSEPDAGRFIMAFDNDTAGRGFAKKFKTDFPDVAKKVETDFPPLVEGQEKSDWNDELKYQKNILPRPRSQADIKKTEDIVSKYTTPKVESIDSTPTTTQSKFVKQTIPRVSAKGNPYVVTKIYELLSLTDFSKLEVDRAGRTTLEAVGVLTIEYKKSNFVEAKYSADKILKNNRFVLSFNVPMEQLSRPSLDEIRKLRQEKNGFEIDNPSKLSKQNVASPQNESTTDFEKSLKMKDFNKLHQFLSDDLKNYQNFDSFKKILKLLTFMPKQSEQNIRLLLAQNPNVKHIEDFKTWSDINKRKIKAKSKALKIIVANPQPEVDDNGKVILDKEGNVSITKISESIVSVFDISQTQGSPVDPTISEEISRDKALEIFKSLVQLSSLKIRFTEQPLENENRTIKFENSWLGNSENEIFIKKGLPPKVALQTLVQELVYQKLTVKNENPEIQKFEIEAIRYILLRQQGLETTFSKNSQNISLTQKTIPIILKHIQNNIAELSPTIKRQLNPPKKKTYENSEVAEKTTRFSLKEKMEAAKIKEEALIKQAADQSKKVQGAEHHQAPNNQRVM